MPASERVLDLMIALINSRRMTKREIYERVADYRNSAAFERTFERDKDLLRSLGVPLVTERDATHQDDVGYRIDVEAYRVPDQEFSPQELGVLAVAASVYDAAAWRAQAGRGVTKVLGLGPAVIDDEAPPLRLELNSPDESFDVVLDAIAARRRIRFSYLAATSGKGTRNVAPWRVITRWGAWYLLGWDEDRGAARAFRLSRVAGAISMVGPDGAFELPAVVDPDEIFGVAAALTVRVAVVPGRATLLRARAQGDGTITLDGEEEPRDVIVFEAAAEPQLVQELAGYAPDVVVLEPADLRAQVAECLRGVGGAHAR